MTKPAGTDVSALLAALKVIRHPGTWRFDVAPHPPKPAVDCPFVFREREGWTFVSPAGEATPKSNRWIWLELAVVSDLNAVGFLAAVSAALAAAGVPCNAIAAYHHDHIFVPSHLADKAVAALSDLSLRDSY